MIYSLWFLWVYVDILCFIITMKVHAQLLSSVQLFSTPCSPPSSSVHRIFPSKITGVDCYFLLHGIFPTHGTNPHHLHCQVDSLPGCFYTWLFNSIFWILTFLVFLILLTVFPMLCIRTCIEWLFPDTNIFLSIHPN